MRFRSLPRRLCRRLIALGALGALLLQTFIAGAGYARALSALDPIGVICHGSSASAPDRGTDPAHESDTRKAVPDCCLVCATMGCGALGGRPSLQQRAPLAGVAAQSQAVPVVVLAPEAVRAGRSQAPPSRG